MILFAAEVAKENHIYNLRIDTHEKNEPMLASIARAGFKECGIVTMFDGTSRKAFQKIL